MVKIFANNFLGDQILKKNNPKCVIDCVTLIKMAIVKSIFITSLIPVRTLTKPRYLDVKLLLLGREKPMLALCMFLLCGQYI